MLDFNFTGDDMNATHTTDGYLIADLATSAPDLLAFELKKLTDAILRGEDVREEAERIQFLWFTT